MIKMVIAKSIKVVRSVSGTVCVVNDEVYTERLIYVGDIAIVNGEYVVGVIHTDRNGIEIWNDQGAVVAPGAQGECSAALPAAVEIRLVRKDERRTYFDHPNIPAPMWCWNREAAKFNGGII